MDKDVQLFVGVILAFLATVLITVVITYVGRIHMFEVRTKAYYACLEVLKVAPQNTTLICTLP